MTPVDPISLTVTSIEGDPEHPTALLMSDDAGRTYRVSLPSPSSRAVSSAPTPAQLAMEVVQLSPREIQAAIRGGMSAQEVADTYGVDLERIQRFEGPVLLERFHIADRAGSTELRRSSGSVALSVAVAARLAERGDDAGSLEWDAWRRDDGRWTVQATWLTIGSDIGGDIDQDAMATARWIYDNVGRTIAPDDAAARGLVEEQTPAETVAAPAKAPAGGDPYEGAASVDDLTALADATAPTVVIERPVDLAARPSGSWTPVIVEGGRNDDTDMTVPQPTGISDSADSAESAAIVDMDVDFSADGDEIGVDVDLDVDIELDDEGIDIHADLAPDGTDDNEPAIPAVRDTSGSRKRTSVPSWDEILFGTTPSGRDE
jgi:hypothetical protein